MPAFGYCVKCGLRRQVARSANRTATYCRRCQPPRTVAKSCAHCLAPVPRTKNLRRKYCDACVEAKAWEALVVYTSALRKPCALCGTIRMTARGSLPVGQYTCHACRRSNEQHRIGLRDKRRLSQQGKSGDHRRRARQFGVEYEPVNRRRVFDRDRWTCGICGLKVDRRLAHPDAMAASLDHVVPMSKGGGHTYANTQCSHLICNVRKGARGIAGEQLALVG